MDYRLCKDTGIDLSRLIADIEIALNKNHKSPKDFDSLSRRIFARTGEIISPHTLKRIWGYLPSHVKPRKSTLDILAAFIGYRNFDQYIENADLPDALQSSPVLSRHFYVDELKPGAIIRLLWKPQRVCDIRYLGDRQFVVLHSQNTRLLPGDTFSCTVIIDSEPLYISNLRQGDKMPIAYICGKIDGIKYEFLHPSSTNTPPLSSPKE